MPVATAASPTLSAASAGSYLRASPANVSIKAIEIYVPNTCVEQSDLEAHDGVAQGKYVVGLGQKRMGFCDDREAIYSITLTAVSSLLKKYNIHPNSTGRLKVGTETLIDKFKSKSFARLAYNDFKAQPDAPQFANIDPALKDMAYDASLTDCTAEEAFMSYTTKTFQQRVAPAMMGPTQCGNMYTASLYSGLASLLSNVNSKNLMGKNVGMFSYGTGLASTLFSLQTVGDTTQMQSALKFNERLENRIVASPTEYEKVMWLREKIHLQNNYTLYGDIYHPLPGTYYLTSIDKDYQHCYEIT